jgi:hypothetical protein
LLQVCSSDSKLRAAIGRRRRASWRQPERVRRLQVLRDLLDPGQRGTASAQVVMAGVHVGLLSEGRVVVAGPLAHDGDGHIRMRHQGQRGVPGVVQRDSGQSRPLEQPDEFVRVPLRITYSPPRYQSRVAGPVRLAAPAVALSSICRLRIRMS